MDRIHLEAKNEFDLIIEISDSWYNKEYLVYFAIHDEGKLEKPHHPIPCSIEIVLEEEQKRQRTL